mmetsp:Transcript_333/g.1201  ORF Transcript_333/g.1201 Transcript_333/m.1201 type:complete len:119 (+) Transcript_333:366-722(+)
MLLLPFSCLPRNTLSSLHFLYSSIYPFSFSPRFEIFVVSSFVHQISFFESNPLFFRIGIAGRISSRRHNTPLTSLPYNDFPTFLFIPILLGHKDSWLAAHSARKSQRCTFTNTASSQD